MFIPREIITIVLKLKSKRAFLDRIRAFQKNNILPVTSLEPHPMLIPIANMTQYKQVVNLTPKLELKRMVHYEVEEGTGYEIFSFALCFIYRKDKFGRKKLISYNSALTRYDSEGYPIDDLIYSILYPVP